MSNQINYFDKYIKYKIKYNQLKNLSGGTHKNIFIVATHSYRLQCILNAMRVKSYVSMFQHIKRFKNCAIVRIFRDDKTGDTCVQLIYEGIYPGYNDATDDTHYEEGEKNRILLRINNKLSQDYSIPANVEIYFIRHGEGIHNTLNKAEKEILKNESTNPEKIALQQRLLDAHLNENGHTQAHTSGIELNKYFNSRQDLKSVTYKFCASDLHRTQETIAHVKYNLNNNYKGNKIDPIFIISCIHEIAPISEIRETYATVHDCDNPNKILKPSSIYNTPKCTITQLHLCQTLTIPISSNPIINHNENINWSHFKTPRDKCHNNKNIIEQILELIPKIT
jgi:hypothetical protein